MTSISGQSEQRAIFIRMQMEGLGADVELCDIGKQTLSDDSIIKLPPVLFVTPGNAKTPFMHFTDLKFCFEAMEESVEEILENKDTFLNNINFTCISDSYYSYYYFIEIIDYKPDLHSGIFGGSVLFVLDTSQWQILIQDIMNLVASVTNEERKLYETLDFGEYRADIGAIKLLSDSKEKILMKRWRYLTLLLHGWRRCEMVIPAKVTGKFSIRLVPKMKPAKVNRVCLTKFSPNHFENSVLLLPIRSSDDMAYSQNEKINLVNYMDGIKLLRAYILELCSL
ncbi:unnamed protein product [Brugia pahangi]|uniref:Glutaredoxin domain-containing protein n=1 Tax=Brugia pahangi TaxID=6280 RepID=A0A0N4SX80_BRUPA|nr:unnamed protein product [Brugia pahangi]